MARINVKDLTHYAFLDPGSGKSKDQLKRRSARSAIVVIAADWLRRLYLRDAWAGRVNTTVIYDKIVEFNDRYKPKIFGIEANAQQTLFFDQLVNRAQSEGKIIPFHAVNQPTRIEKAFRIRSAIQPALGAGQIFFPDGNHLGVLELTNEMRTHPMSPTVDLVDAFASAISLVPSKTPRRVVDAELSSRLQYLRETGAPPEYIERVAQGLE